MNGRLLASVGLRFCNKRLLGPHSDHSERMIRSYANDVVTQHR